MATKKKAPRTKRTRTTLPAAEIATRPPIRCAGAISKEARAKVSQLLARGNLPAARVEDRIGRVFCGQDLSTLIYGHPYDGKEFTVVCPRCGSESSHRNVPFDEVRSD